MSHENMVDNVQFENIGNGLLVRAPAKINLSLLIAGKRPDGFHEIETVMAKINWYDEILIEPNLKTGIKFICQGSHWAPPAQDNLVYQAAELLLDNCKTQVDIKLTLNKNVPAGSGLGSASSDAAATLMGLNRYLDLKLPDRQLTRLAAQLGSDVAFFLDGPLALCCGKGEKIKKINKKFDFLAFLILPDISVSTKKVYDNYQHNQDIYQKLSTEINSYIHKNRIDLVVKMCANMLEESCFGLEKELAKLKEKIESLGIGPVCLSGSGSAMFCIIEDRDIKRAESYSAQLAEKIGCKSIIVRNNRW
jgi:4-diphosphocytidyl-2-C-methyl-D-erythritol kinase